MEKGKAGVHYGVKADSGFVKIVDRGIDDMEAGRELPLREAIRKVEELRKARRDARV